jgi:hypothetical protein
MRCTGVGTFARRVSPLLLCPAAGAGGAVLYAVLCAALYLVVSGNSGFTGLLIIRAGVAGALAGAVLGVCRALDWSLEPMQLSTWNGKQKARSETNRRNSHLPDSARDLSLPVPGVAPWR